jgi:hypothetical protein
MQSADLRKLSRSPLTSPLFEGANRIQRMVIARHLAKGCVDLTELRVPATEVARCAGHRVTVLPRSTRTASTGRLCRHKRITDETESKPDDEGDYDIE